MRKLDLSEWASVGELIGTLAVVVSLIFVVHSVNQNTAAIQGSNENLIFERHTELTTNFMLDPSLAAILVKMRGENPELTEIEAVRWEKYQLNLLDTWALAYSHYERDLLAPRQWNEWDRYFIALFQTGGERLSKEQWEEWKYGYGDKFWSHVGQSLF
jgi:hypothetical protein